MEETVIALLPGSAFGIPAEKFIARLSYVDFDGRKALDFAKSIPDNNTLDDDFLESIAGHMLDGIHQLKNWLED